GRDEPVESRFAAIGDVAMNDAALSCFIERGNQAANMFCIRLGGATDTFLQCAQPSPNTAVLSGARKRLPGTFRCGFGVSHFYLNRASTVAQAAKMSRCRSCEDADYVRGADASLICEESFLNPEPEAGASKP